MTGAAVSIFELSQTNPEYISECIFWVTPQDVLTAS